MKRFEVSARLSTGMSTCPCHPAFSLVEIMIATIILGFGLLMIGAVLPIAWKGSIDASAFTRADGATQAATYYITHKCLVDGPRDLFDLEHRPFLLPDDPPASATPDGVIDSITNPEPNLRDKVSYSFQGDYDTQDLVDDNNDGTPDDLNVDGVSDVRPLVHALHLENWAVDENSTFIPGFNGPADRSVPEAPILIETGPLDTRAVGIPASLTVWGAYEPLGDPNLGDAVGAPVIKLRERVFPPLPDTLTPQDPQWSDVLNSRNFAWAVLHKLARIPRSPADPRHFLIYHFTLRRGASTARFARQDPSDDIVPVVEPTALPDTEDVMFPIAWRVPLVVMESQSGLPAIAFAGADDDNGNSDLTAVLPSITPAPAPPYPVDNTLCRVADMFPRGSVFVDEENGNVYQVTDREFVPNSVGDFDVLARLTLDVAVKTSELVRNPAMELVNPADPESQLLAAFAFRRNRVVWVFPPAVAPGSRAANDGGVKFVGANPVVDIRVEPLTLLP